MTEAGPGLEPVHVGDDEISLLALGSVLLRSRQMIVALSLLGTVLGLLAGLLSTRLYVSAATFIPQGAEGGSASALALAASQFGIRTPASGAAWGPPIYVKLLGSWALLEPIVLDTMVVAEQGGRRVALMDLLKVKAPTPARRTERAILALRDLVSAAEDKKLGAVQMTVTTEWPSVSLALAERLVGGVNQFILKTRKSQAAAERQFVEVQAGEAERALREAEDDLQQFLQVNRAIANSPGLGFQHDRLQRRVALRQQVYASLMQSREDARIREVRDTPVITMLESPRLPVEGEARNSVKKALLGGFFAGTLGALVAFLLQAVAVARRVPNEAAREFFKLMEEARPRFLRRWGRS